MAIVPFPLHPLTYLAVQKSTIILLLAFTSPDSILRPLLFPVLVFCNYCLLPLYNLHIPRSAWVAYISGEVLIGLLDYVEKLLLSQWSFEDHGPSAEIRKRSGQGKRQSRRAGVTEALGKGHAITPLPLGSSHEGVWDRLKFGVWVAVSHRYIGSPYQARNVPPYSASDPSYVPTRRIFLLRRGLVFLACYLITDILVQGNQPDQNPVVFAETHVPFFTRLHDVSANEILTRITTTIGFWFGAYCSIQAYYSAMAFIAVASGFSSPAERRPFFGSLGNAYTIRGFWGLFWHQLLRKKFTKTARYLSFTVLGLPRPDGHPPLLIKILTRYIQLLLAFALSGILHQTIEVAQGMRWADSGALRFYVLMAGGIMLEDGFQWIFRRVAGRKPMRPGLVRMAGWIWVVLFFSWATPIWVYPILRRNTGTVRDDPLPFSVVGLIRRAVS